MKKVLDIKNLEVNFSIKDKKFYAVRKVSFSLFENETLGIVGESGCGKTTTAHAILKLLPMPPAEISKGKILFENEDLLKKSSKEFIQYRGKKISMIFQDPMSALNPTMKIGKQLTEILFGKNKKERAIDLLNQVGIPDPHLRFSQYPHELSGGQRQRVMIAIAIAQNPKVIIADEPTTALDVTIQSQILDLLKDIQRRLNSSIIFISHDLNVIANICDRIIVMYAGEIVEEASTKDLIFSAKHPYTKLLLKSTAKIDDDSPLIPIKGSPPLLSEIIKGCSFYKRCPYSMQICKDKKPLFISDKKEHGTACHLYDKNLQKEKLKDVIRKQAPSDKESEKILQLRK